MSTQNAHSAILHSIKHSECSSHSRIHAACTLASSLFAQLVLHQIRPVCRSHYRCAYTRAQYSDNS